MIIREIPILLEETNFIYGTRNSNWLKSCVRAHFIHVLHFLPFPPLPPSHSLFLFPFLNLQLILSLSLTNADLNKEGEKESE